MNLEEAFLERDSVLRILGFDSYADYLKSDLWAWIREALMKLPEAKCCHCCKATTGLTWHHESYDIKLLIGNFANRRQYKSILRLCSECHRVGHFLQDGTFVKMLSETNVRIAYLAKWLAEDPYAALDDLHAELDKLCEP
jgi:hypothetical protein